MRLICAYPSVCLYPDAYAAHLDEMRGMGFCTVVLCVPEHYVTYSLPAVQDIIRATHAAGLACWADPWAVAGVFDGEAPHAPTGDPDAVVRAWIDAVGNTHPSERPDAVFLDNPHPADPARIAAWAAQARGYGMGCQVCLSAVRHAGDLELFRRVAALDGVDGIWTDPYCLDRARAAAFDVEGFVGGWARDLAGIGAEAGKESGVWVQGWGLPAGVEVLPVRAARAALGAGVDGVGFWGFRACPTWQGRPDRHEAVWRGFGSWARGVRDDEA
jgi:hypothetical protein